MSRPARTSAASVSPDVVATRATDNAQLALDIYAPLKTRDVPPLVEFSGDQPLEVFLISLQTASHDDFFGTSDVFDRDTAPPSPKTTPSYLCFSPEHSPAFDDDIHSPYSAASTTSRIAAASVALLFVQTQ